MSKLGRKGSFSTSKMLGYPLLSHLSQKGPSQQTDNDVEIKTVMYFVIPPGETEEGCLALNLGEMYQTAVAHFLNVQWIRDEDCEDIPLESDGNVLVFDSFDSPGFKYWEANAASRPYRVEILGPQVLRYIFNSQEVLSFSTKSFPTYTLAMRNMIISLSGFKDLAEKEELDQKIRWMNGTISKTLTKAVTIVVTATALTDKSLEAHRSKVLVVTAEWVREAWKDNQKSSVDASNSKFVKKHMCPIFYNVNICLSQLKVTRKNMLKEAVEELGGKCTPDMRKDVTDVLVITAPEGEKYKFATRWKLRCVSPEWIESSIEQGYLLPPGHFKVELSIEKFVTSTPAHSFARGGPSFNLDNTRCSAINEPSKMVVNETNETMKTTMYENPRQDVIDRVAAIKTTGYLDGLRIFIVDYEKHFELKRAINSSGAIRHDQLCDGVTHVIIPGQRLSKSMQRKVEESDPIPSLVTIDWVLQSALLGYPADDEEFKFGEDNLPSASFDVAASTNVCRVSATRTDTVNIRESRVSESGMLQNNYSEVLDQPIVSNVPETTFGNEEPEETTGEDTTDSTGTETRNTLNTNAGDESSPGVLVGITFYIGTEDREEYKFLKNLIEERGGEIKKANTDVAILPPVCKPTDIGIGDKAFTKDWLFDCLSIESLDIEIQVHYIPRPAFKKMGEILKGVVIAVSQYPSNVRGYLTELVTAMGGRYQEVFSRKDVPNGSSVKSTHLICKNMDTDKARAAKRWNVPVVVSDWIIDSYLAKKRLNELNYDPSVQPSTSDERTMYMATPRQSTAPRRDNTSMRSVYPPSTSKAAPVSGIETRTHPAVSNPKPSEPAREELRRDPSPTLNELAMPTPVATTSAASKNTKMVNPSSIVIAKSNQKKDGACSDLKGDDLDAVIRAQKEAVLRGKAKLQAEFPYTDESFDRMLNGYKEKGVNLDEVSPFTSFEENRLCNISSATSPVIPGYTRQESRMLQEQVGIALMRSPSGPKIKFKTPTSTPMSEIVRKFNAEQKTPNLESGSKSQEGSPRTSTPKSDGHALRKMIARSKLSLGTQETSMAEIVSPQANIEIEGLGIRKLDNGNKRPSDGSPGEEQTRSTKRARSSEEEDNDNATDVSSKPKSLSPPKENVFPGTEGLDRNAKTVEKPSSSKKQNSMQQALTNLIAERKANYPESGNMSPIKRRSGDAVPIIVPCDDEDVHEEVERPHLSWVDDDDDNKQSKKSTVKRNENKRRVPSALNPETEPLPEENGGKKRSSRLKKASSEVGEPERASRRTRSQSKTRKEDTAPYGHQPMKTGTEGKKSKKQTFPRHLSGSPVFILSSLNAEEKNQATEIITSLGGSVSSLSHFDPDCSALVAKSLLRSEKVLGCIAAGKYLLKYDYLLESSEKHRFIPIDETFLWHEDNAGGPKEKELARFSFNWVKARVLEKSKGPMAGMKFYFYKQPKDKLAAYMRLVTAGGGEVVGSLDEATVVIGDETLTVPEGVQQANPMFLNTLILTDPPV